MKSCKIVTKKTLANRSYPIVPLDEWRAATETFYLLSIPQMGQSIVIGLKSSIGECYERLEWEYDKKDSR